MTVLKALVACLALANLGYFLWIHGVAQEPEAAALAPPTKRLELVSAAPAAVPAAQADRSGLVGAGSDPDPSSDAGVAGLANHVKRCVSVGPFHDVAEAARAAGTLRAGGYDPRQRVVDGEVWSGVWLYVAVPARPGAGDQLMASLKSAGIDDALEMPGPSEGTVISLGLYGDQKRAQGRVAQAQSLGLTTVFADRKRTGNLYWIDIDLNPTDGPLNPADFQRDTGRISRLEVKSCPSVGAPP